MKMVTAYAIAILALACLTLVFLRGVNPRHGQHAPVLQAIDAFERAEAALHRDALRVRAGLLRNYDPLVADVAALETAAATLRERTRDWPDAGGARDRLERSVETQVALVETLKSESALSHNSLAYVSRSTAAARPAPAADGALAASVLRLALDTSPDSQQGVDAALSGALHTIDRSSADAGGRDVLLAHVRLLRVTLPALDRSLAALTASLPQTATSELQTLAERRARAAARGASRARIGLGVTAAVLLTLLLHLSLRLHHHVRILARRSQRERAAAILSAELIGARSEDVDKAVVDALGSMARAIGAHRAYLLVEGAGPAQWMSPRAEDEADWPARALELATTLRPGDVGELLLSAGSPTSSATRAALADAGVASLAMVWVTNEEGRRAMLGLDAPEGRLDLSRDDLDLLKLVLDATAGGVRRARLERARLELERRLEEAGRMEALGGFASGIAHNVNNILAAIGGYAEMATASATRSGPVVRQIGEIQKAVTRGRDLVDRILAFGRRRSVPQASVDLAELVRDAAALLEAAHGGDVAIALDLAQAPEAILGDAVDLQQVILNLGANALRAVQDGGGVSIAVDRRQVSQGRRCALGQLTPGAYARVSVRDTGCGMAPAVLGRIFEPFFTTAEGGHGLGLATVGEIVRDHGGAIDVTSRPGEGTLFDVWLACAPAVRSGAAPGASVLALCASAEEMVALEDMLAALSFEPTGHQGLAAAITCLRDHPHNFDAVVLSHPVGAEARTWAGTIHRVAPHLPLVLATAAAPRDRELPNHAGVLLTAWPPTSHGLARALQRSLQLAA